MKWDWERVVGRDLRRCLRMGWDNTMDLAFAILWRDNRCIGVAALHMWQRCAGVFGGFLQDLQDVANTAMARYNCFSDGEISVIGI